MAGHQYRTIGGIPGTLVRSQKGRASGSHQIEKQLAESDGNHPGKEVGRSTLCDICVGKLPDGVICTTREKMMDLWGCVRKEGDPCPLKS